MRENEKGENDGQFVGVTWQPYRWSWSLECALFAQSAFVLFSFLIATALKVNIWYVATSCTLHV